MHGLTEYNIRLKIEARYFYKHKYNHILLSHHAIVRTQMLHHNNEYVYDQAKTAAPKTVYWEEPPKQFWRQFRLNYWAYLPGQGARGIPISNGIGIETRG